MELVSKIMEEPILGDNEEFWENFNELYLEKEESDEKEKIKELKSE